MSGVEPASAPASRVEWLGRTVENALLGGALFAMIGLAAAQVLWRVALGGGFAWADEALRLLVLWSAMLGAVAASRDNVHLRIDLLSRFLPPGWQRLGAALVDLFAAAVSGILGWCAWRFVADSQEFGDQVLGGLPAWPFQAILPTAFALISYRYLAQLPRHMRPSHPLAGDQNP